MSRRQVAFAVAAGVALVVTAVAPLREQAVTQWRLLPLPGTTGSLIYGQSGGQQALAQEAARIVDREWSDDPDMCLGVGVLLTVSDWEVTAPREAATSSRPVREARYWLRRATELGGSPASCAAYVGVLVDGVQFSRLETEGVDPEDQEEIAEARAAMAERKEPERIEEESAEAILRALQGWQRADPENGLPIALEAWVRYGLGEDRRAVARWKEAGQRPFAMAYEHECQRAARELLVRMGVPEMEAAFATMAVRHWFALSPPVRAGARMAFYEGRLAQMRGETEEALALWNATVALGRHMMEDSTIGFTVGSGVYRIGAIPAWIWVSDTRSGESGGPLSGGRLWYGHQHEAYQEWVGEEADARLRDSLVAVKVRGDTIHEHYARMFDDGWLSRLAVALVAPRLGLVPGLFAAVMLVLCGVAGLRSRGGGDSVLASVARAEATAGLFWWQVGAAVVGGVVMVVGVTIGSGRTLLVGVSGTLFALLTIAVISAWRHRRMGRSRAHWSRGAAAGCAVMALLYLTSLTASAIAREKLSQEYTSPEITRVAATAGDAWRHPMIPEDSWRAEHPREGPGVTRR